MLASPNAVLSLPNILAKERVLERTLQNVGSPEGSYTALSHEDVLAMAVGIGMSPLSPTTRAFRASVGQAIPEVGTLWQAGGRHLELGCGSGNALLSILATHSNLTAVGIEIDGGVLSEARRRAEALDVADRVELRHPRTRCS